MKTQHGILLTMVLMGLMSVTVRATDYFVSTNGGNLAPYTNWAMAATNLNSAAAWANTNNAGDTVWVSNGTHFITATVPVTNIIVRGFSGNPADTLVNGGNAVRCFAVNHSNALVTGMTISNGNAFFAGGGGGGVYLLNGMISNCAIVNNTATNGGGIYTTNGIISNCRISANAGAGTGGGGVYLYYGGVIRNGCVINNNSASTAGGTAGGVYAYSGGLIQDSTINSNSAVLTGMAGGVHLAYGGIITNCQAGWNSTVYGGGLRIVGTGPQIWNCTINNNTASYGAGGVYSAAHIGTIANCVIRNNSAVHYGGGLDINYATILQNCLIYRNTAAGGLATDNGGGVCANADTVGKTNIIRSCTIVSNIAFAGGGVRLKCNATNMVNIVVDSTIYNNTATNGVGPDLYNYNAPTNGNLVSYSCMSDTNGFTGAGNFTNDPRFISPASTNYRLAEGSPCIDRGLNETWMNGAVDLDTNSRVFHNRPDIGAYEYRFRGAFFSIQ